MPVDEAVLGVAVLTAGFYAGIVLLFGGLMRIPWRYAGQIALGVGMVVASGALASEPWGSSLDQGWLIIAAAVGGGIAVRAYERGVAARRAIIEAIVGQP